MNHITIISWFVFIVILSTQAQQEEFQRFESLFYCMYDSDCGVGSFCVGNDGTNRGKCRCKDGFVMVNRNRSSFLCLEIVKDINLPCEMDVQCQVNLGKAAICKGPEIYVCQCEDGAYYGDGRCHKRVALGEICESNYNCRLADGTYGFCTNHKCTCNLLHHASAEGDRCIESVLLGKPCKTTESCIHTAAKCYDNICRCIGGYIESSNHSRCFKAASQVGDSCTENVECSAYITGSFCKNEVCSCKSAHHGYGNECVRDARLEEPCWHDKECIISAELQHSVKCTSGFCACVEGVSDENFYGCILISSAPEYIPKLVMTIFFAYFVINLNNLR